MWFLLIGGGALFAVAAGLFANGDDFDLGSLGMPIRKLTPAQRVAYGGNYKSCATLRRTEVVLQQLGIAPGAQLPDHIVQFGRYMLTMKGRQLDAADVVKAYLLTLSSIQRESRYGRTLRLAWPDHPFEDDKLVRPEHAFAELLLHTPEGKRFLRATVAGKVDEVAADRVYRRFRVYGDANRMMRRGMREAAGLAAIADEVARGVRELPRKAWFELARAKFFGIDTTKAGFLASLLGRGDLGTMDAREEDLWVEPTGGKKVKINWPLIVRFNDRLTEVDVAMPDELRPFYEHLTHHFLWEKAGGVEETHAKICEAMLAQLGGR